MRRLYRSPLRHSPRATAEFLLDEHPFARRLDGSILRRSDGWAADRHGDVALHGYRRVDTACASARGRLRRRSGTASELLRKAVADSGGHEVECQADEFFAVFQRAKDGAAAAVAAPRLLAEHAWPEGVSLRVRMGLHTGEPGVEGGGYLGVDVHRAARICAAGHGDQILLSQTTRDLVANGVEVKDLGSYWLAGLPAPERLFQLLVPGLGSEFPPLRAESGQRRRKRAGCRDAAPRGGRRDAAAGAAAALPGDPAATTTGRAWRSLFTADRAVGGAGSFLARVDHKQLTSRLAVQRPSASTPSKPTRKPSGCRHGSAGSSYKNATTHSQASPPNSLTDSTRSAHNRRSPSSMNRSAPPPRRSTRPSAGRQGARPLELQTRRNRRRGVYHAAHRYIVPYSDDHGRDRPRIRHPLEARDFKTALRLTEQARRKVDQAA